MLQIYKINIKGDFKVGSQNYVLNSVSDQMWNMVPISPSAPVLWCCTLARKVYLQNITKSQWSRPLTFWKQNGISLWLYPIGNFLSKFIIISILLLEFWPKTCDLDHPHIRSFSSPSERLCQNSKKFPHGAPEISRSWVKDRQMDNQKT